MTTKTNHILISKQIYVDGYIIHSDKKGILQRAVCVNSYKPSFGEAAKRRTVMMIKYLKCNISPLILNKRLFNK